MRFGNSMGMSCDDVLEDWKLAMKRCRLPDRLMLQITAGVFVLALIFFLLAATVPGAKHRAWQQAVTARLAQRAAEDYTGLPKVGRSYGGSSADGEDEGRDLTFQVPSINNLAATLAGDERPNATLSSPVRLRQYSHRVNVSFAETLGSEEAQLWSRQWHVEAEGDFGQEVVVPNLAHRSLAVIMMEQAQIPVSSFEEGIVPLLTSLELQGLLPRVSVVLKETCFGPAGALVPQLLAEEHFGGSLSDFHIAWGSATPEAAGNASSIALAAFLVAESQPALPEAVSSALWDRSHPASFLKDDNLQLYRGADAVGVEALWAAELAAEFASVAAAHRRGQARAVAAWVAAALSQGRPWPAALRGGAAIESSTGAALEDALAAVLHAEGVLDRPLWRHAVAAQMGFNGPLGWALVAREREAGASYWQDAQASRPSIMNRCPVGRAAPGHGASLADYLPASEAPIPPEVSCWSSRRIDNEVADLARVELTEMGFGLRLPSTSMLTVLDAFANGLTMLSHRFTIPGSKNALEWRFLGDELFDDGQMRSRLYETATEHGGVGSATGMAYFEVDAHKAHDRWVAAAPGSQDMQSAMNDLAAAEGARVQHVFHDNGVTSNDAVCRQSFVQVRFSTDDFISCYAILEVSHWMSSFAKDFSFYPKYVRQRRVMGIVAGRNQTVSFEPDATGLSAGPFVRLSIRELLQGYDDALTAALGAGRFPGIAPESQPDLSQWWNAVASGGPQGSMIGIDTGATDPDRVGTLLRYAGATSLEWFNQVSAVGGSLDLQRWPARVHRRAGEGALPPPDTLEMWDPRMARRIPAMYKGAKMDHTGQLHVWRYEQGNGQFYTPVFSLDQQQPTSPGCMRQASPVLQQRGGVAVDYLVGKPNYLDCEPGVLRMGLAGLEAPSNQTHNSWVEYEPAGGLGTAYSIKRGIYSRWGNSRWYPNLLTVTGLLAVEEVSWRLPSSRLDPWAEELRRLNRKLDKTIPGWFNALGVLMVLWCIYQGMRIVVIPRVVKYWRKMKLKADQQRTDEEKRIEAKRQELAERKRKLQERAQGPMGARADMLDHDSDEELEGGEEGGSDEDALSRFASVAESKHSPQTGGKPRNKGKRPRRKSVTFDGGDSRMKFLVAEHTLNHADWSPTPRQGDALPFSQDAASLIDTRRLLDYCYMAFCDSSSPQLNVLGYKVFRLWMQGEGKFECLAFFEDYTMYTRLRRTESRRKWAEAMVNSYDFLHILDPIFIFAAGGEGARPAAETEASEAVVETEAAAACGGRLAVAGVLDDAGGAIASSPVPQSSNTNDGSLFVRHALPQGGDGSLSEAAREHLRVDASVEAIIDLIDQMKSKVLRPSRPGERLRYFLFDQYAAYVLKVIHWHFRCFARDVQRAFGRRQARIGPASQAPSSDFLRAASADRAPTMDDFVTLGTIGNGSYGCVQVWQSRATGVRYAVKSMLKKLLKHKNSIHCAVRELAITTLVQSPFICSIDYAFESADHVHFALRMMWGGDLERLLLAQPERRFSEPVVKFYAAQLVVALKHCHRAGVLHRDIKASNVLLDERGNLKLTDFGLSIFLHSCSPSQPLPDRVCDNEAAYPPGTRCCIGCRQVEVVRAIQHGHFQGNSLNAANRFRISCSCSVPIAVTDLWYKGRAGTPAYWAPEMLQRTRSGGRLMYGTSVDWWSLGCLLYALFTGQSPFSSGRGQEADNALTLRHNPEFDPSLFSADAADFVGRLLERDPTKRLGCGPTAWEEVMRHPWLGDMDFELVTSRAYPAPIVPPYRIREDLAEIPDKVEGHSAHRHAVESARRMAGDLQATQLQRSDCAMFNAMVHLDPRVRQMEAVMRLHELVRTGDMASIGSSPSSSTAPGGRGFVGAEVFGLSRDPQGESPGTPPRHPAGSRAVLGSPPRVIVPPAHMRSRSGSAAFAGAGRPGSIVASTPASRSPSIGISGSEVSVSVVARRPEEAGVPSDVVLSDQAIVYRTPGFAGFFGGAPAPILRNRRGRGGRTRSRAPSATDELPGQIVGHLGTRALRAPSDPIQAAAAGAHSDQERDSAAFARSQLRHTVDGTEGSVAGDGGRRRVRSFAQSRDTGGGIASAERRRRSGRGHRRQQSSGNHSAISDAVDQLERSMDASVVSGTSPRHHQRSNTIPVAEGDFQSPNASSTRSRRRGASQAAAATLSLTRTAPRARVAEGRAEPPAAASANRIARSQTFDGSSPSKRATPDATPSDEGTPADMPLARGEPVRAGRRR